MILIHTPLSSSCSQAFGILDEYSTFQVTIVALRNLGVIAILSQDEEIAINR
jgi:hypothetical protein